MTRSPRPTRRLVEGPEDLEALSFWENGLLPVVAQDARTGEVLMVAFSNREALDLTLETGQMHYWSRSRKEIWHKGATSGNYQELVSLHADCDGDTLLARVHPAGPACHTGEPTCFGDLAVPETGPGGRPAPSQGSDREVSSASAPSDSRRDHDAAGRRTTAAQESTLPNLWALLEDRAASLPEGSYTARLLGDENLRLKKLGEETAELILALARDQRDRIPEEAGDLVYHLLVALLASGTTLRDLLEALESRRA